jgi:hypothetical protein
MQICGQRAGDTSHQLPNGLDILNHFAILAIDAAIKRTGDKDNLADYHVVFNAVLVAEVCYGFLGHWLRSVNSAALSANLIAVSFAIVPRLAAAVKRRGRLEIVKFITCK